MSTDFPDKTQERLEILDRLRVVLVSPKFPGNLGMSARAMKNSGLSDLRLVSPRAELNKEAYQMAPTGGEILDSATITGSLRDAVSDCGLVIGTTRRRGVMRRNVISPAECAVMLRGALVANKAALVFGAEDTGLSNDDLALCHWIVGIHTGSGAESFNLSHSVAILSYLINREVVEYRPPARKLATAVRLENMFVDLARFLIETGFLHEKDPKRMMVTIRQIFHRSGLSEREVKIIRGILRQARWRIKNPDAPLEPRDTPQWLKKKKSKDPKGD